MTHIKRKMQRNICAYRKANGCDIDHLPQVQQGELSELTKSRAILDILDHPKVEGINIVELSPRLQDEFTKLVATLVSEGPDVTNNILLIGSIVDEQLKIFLAATKIALEVAGHSRSIKRTTGDDDLILSGSDDLTARLRESDIPAASTYGAGSRRHRYLLIRGLHAFPFERENGMEEFADIEESVRIVATTSRNAKLPEDIKELFKIKVDFGEPLEHHSKNSTEKTNQHINEPIVAIGWKKKGKDGKKQKRKDGLKYIEQATRMSQSSVRKYAQMIDENFLKDRSRKTDSGKEAIHLTEFEVNQIIAKKNNY